MDKHDNLPVGVAKLMTVPVGRDPSDGAVIGEGVGVGVVARKGKLHDDVMIWKHFRVTGHLCREFTGPGEFPTQRPVTRSFDVLFDLRLNKQLSKHSSIMTSS